MRMHSFFIVAITLINLFLYAGRQLENVPLNGRSLPTCGRFMVQNNDTVPIVISFKVLERKWRNFRIKTIEKNLTPRQMSVLSILDENGGYFLTARITPDKSSVIAFTTSFGKNTNMESGFTHRINRNTQ